jgi:Rrf2 family protein
MIKINRTSEYGLIALRHMSRKSSHEVTSAREIADTYGLPFEITAKTLLRLKDSGLIQSAQGAKGGYMLQRSLQEIHLAEFLGLMEGPQSMVACSPQHADSEDVKSLGVSLKFAGCQCEYSPRCEIKDVMNDLNGRLFQFLAGIPLAEITGK